MSPLLRYPCCFCEVAESAKWLMDVSEVSALRRHHNHLFCQRTSFSSCSRFLRSTRLIYPNIRHGTHFGNIVRFTLVVGNRHTTTRPSMMSMENDKSSSTFKGLCKVVWTLEADLAAGQLVYITGDPVVMGCWEPEMAILMSPIQQANLWKAEVEISGGVNIKYNYFIKEEMWPYDIIWRSGPELSLSVPLSTKHGKTLVIWDSWIRFRGKISVVHPLQSWIEESFLLTHPFTLTQAVDEEEAVNFYGSNVIAAEPYLNDLTAEDDLYSESDVASRMQVKCLESDLMEPEPYLNDPTAEDNLYSKIDLAGAIHNNSISGRCVTERCHPVEEPWLFHSPLFSSVFEDQQELDVNKETAEDKETNVEDTRKLKPQEESSIIWRDPVSTVILINSSLCTMQRIAVLEDEKLVELLLEPVKSNVQCDSVYLGVVTKLVPHMGGAFVNIGGSRPSLMDIKHNREPYIFPPFCQIAMKGEANGSVLEVFEEHSNADETAHASLSVQVMNEITESGFGESSTQSSHEDYDEHDIEDDYDAEVLADNMNGSAVSYNEREADSESYSERRENHLGAEAINRSLHVDINGSSDHHMPHLLDAYSSGHKITHKNKWVQVQKGTKIIVQVVKEGLGTKGPTLTAYPKLKSRFWILITRCDRIGVSKKLAGVERTRLKVIAKTLQPQGFGLTVRTVAAGHSLEELQNDLEGLLSTWKSVVEHAKSAALAADEGVEGAVPIILHRAMGQTLSVVQDYFNEKVERMVVDSARTYHEVTNYLQEIAPDLCDRVELHDKRIPLFDEYNIEDEINNLLSKRVSLANGGSLVIEQTEALVSIDVNGGHGMFGHGTSQEKAILDVNLAAAKQIARELRLRDIGGIIVVDFIDMEDESNKRLVYEEVKKAVDRDRSIVKVSELSRHGLMEITRKRVRPSVTFMISEPCTCCHGTGRVEALETSFSKIEQEISRMLATMVDKPDPENPKSWPKFILRLDHHMCDYLTSGKRTRLAILSSSLKVWILLKVARGFTRGAFEVKSFTDDKANENQHQAATISMLRPTEARSKGPGKRVTLFPIKKWKSGGK